MADDNKAVLIGGAVVVGLGGLAYVLLRKPSEKPPSPPKPEGTITISNVTFTPK